MKQLRRKLVPLRKRHRKKDAYLMGFCCSIPVKVFMFAFRSLSSYFYTRHYAVEFPEEVNEVILVGLCIKKIVGDDLFFFSNLTRMDISDNEVLHSTARRILFE